MSDGKQIDVLDDLTEEERASLADEGTDESNSSENSENVASVEETTIEDDDANAGGDGKPSSDKDKPTDSPGRDDGLDSSGKEVPVEGKNEGEEAPKKDDAQEVEQKIKIETPVFVAHANEQAAARIEAIEAEKLSLAEQFDSGDITAKEMLIAQNKLNNEQNKLQWDINKAELSQEFSAQGEQNKWMREVEAFLNDKEATGGIYQRSDHAKNALDAEIKLIAEKPENQGLSYRKALELAHSNLAKEFGWSTKAEESKETKSAEDKGAVKVKHAQVVPTLGSLPAAEGNQPGDSKFAALDKLDGEDYENALEKLSDNEKNAYLSRG